MTVYQNGLHLIGVGTYGIGRTWSKWFYEHLQAAGLTIKDKDTNGRWVSYKGTGTHGASVSSYPGRFEITGDSYSFTSTDIGRYITISGFTGGSIDRNGVYCIAGVVSSKVVILDILRSVHDNGIPHPFTDLTWRLWAADTSDCPTTSDWFVYTGTGTYGGGYSFDVKVVVGASDYNVCYLPKFEVGPYGDWNATSHAWDSSRKTSLFGFHDYYYSIYYDAECEIVASTASDSLSVATRLIYSTSKSWHILHIGEIDVTDAVTDPYPIIIACGANGYTDLSNVLGTGLESSYTDVHNSARWLAATDNTATVTGYLGYRCVAPWTDSNMCSGLYRGKSPISYKLYDSLISVECRDFSTNGELRGSLRKLTMANEGMMRCKPYGANAEKLHVFGGISIPWNGSNIHNPRVY